MKDVSSKLFYCYAWEDTASVQRILKEMEAELRAKMSTGFEAKYTLDLDDATCGHIDDAEIFVVFISEAAKKSDYVKQCVTRAQHLNKNILPILIEKKSIFSSSMPDEFKFRAKPYSFADETLKSKLFAQLKATLGLNVESGDGFGALIHIVTDRDAKVYRYGEDLGLARAGEDHKIRLKKGSHLLDFVDVNDSTLRYSMEYEVESNDTEQFLNVPLVRLLKERKEQEEKLRREAEQRKKFEESEFAKKLKREQEEREEAVKRQEAELQRKEREIQQQRRQVEREKEAVKKESGDGCLKMIGKVIVYYLIFSLIVGAISLVVSLL